MGVLWLSVLVVQQLHEALHVPAGAGKSVTPSVRQKPRRRRVSPFLHQPDGRLAEQLVGQQVDLPHGVGQTNGQLLPQEDVRRLLTGVLPAWDRR